MDQLSSIFKIRTIETILVMMLSLMDPLYSIFVEKINVNKSGQKIHLMLVQSAKSVDV